MGEYYYKPADAALHIYWPHMRFHSTSAIGTNGRICQKFNNF